MKIRLPMSLCFIIGLAALASATPKMEVLTSTDEQGNWLTRCVTPGSTELLIAKPPTAPSGLDQTVLWTTDHPTSIANNVAVSGNGLIQMTGWYLNSQRTSKYEISGSGAPLWEYVHPSNYYIPVSSSDDGSVVASSGDTTPLNVWLTGAGPTPSWQFTFPTGYRCIDLNVSDNGLFIVAVAILTGGENAKLFVFEAASAALLWETDFNAQTQLIGVEISEDNNWIATTTYHNFYVFNLSTQSLFYTGSNYSQTKAAIDHDAEWLATGDFNGTLHVYQRSGVTYIQRWTNYMGGWVTAVDISSNASKVIAGNFTYSPANAGAVRAFDINGAVLWTYTQYGDYVASVALCNDGSVGVAGSWGQLNATFGDVFTAFNMTSGAVILRLLDDVNEPGSIFSVAISDDGSRATCGGKAVHARIMGNGGEIYAFELGAAGHDVTIALTPENPPIQIPAVGGSFDFLLEISNHEASPVTCDAWIMAQLPTGDWYGPVAGPVSLPLPAGAVVNRDRTQNVPGNARAGFYLYEGRVGIFPNEIWDSSNFQFEKLTTGAGAGVDDWESSDESQLIALADPLIHPASCTLHPSYPNPFNPTTAISYQLEASSYVSLKVYDTAGRLAATLVNGWREAGTHEVTFDATGLISGVYVCRLEAGDFSAVQKLLLLK